MAAGTDPLREHASVSFVPLYPRDSLALTTRRLVAQAFTGLPTGALAALKGCATCQHT
jgi:hypothetical protein